MNLESNNEYKIVKDTLTNKKIIYFVLASLFFVLTLCSFIIFLSLQFSFKLLPDNFNIFGLTPGKNLISILTLVFLIIGLIFLIIPFLKTLKREFWLYKNKIKTKFKSADESDLFFSDIEELYRFGNKNNITNYLAYRENKTKSWIVIPPFLKEDKIKNASKILIENIVDNSVYSSIEKNLLKLEQNKVLDFIDFHNINETNILEFNNSLITLSNKNLKNNRLTNWARDFLINNSEKILIEKTGIIFNKIKITFEKGDSVKFENSKHNKTANEFKETLILLDKDNNEKLNLKLTNIVNGDLFFSLCEIVLDNINNNREISYFVSNRDTNLIYTEKTEDETIDNLKKSAELENDDKLESDNKIEDEISNLEILEPENFEKEEK